MTTNGWSRMHRYQTLRTGRVVIDAKKKKNAQHSSAGTERRLRTVLIGCEDIDESRGVKPVLR